MLLLTDGLIMMLLLTLILEEFDELKGVDSTTLLFTEVVLVILVVDIELLFTSLSFCTNDDTEMSNDLIDDIF
jgi:hypothetical protein